ncbi:glycoside hydrolase family 16 protein [Auriscalpium vulgare]|uniref:Glycoside hydrolase family 16 protein n=1 Tax=Auriscalpium vulgare TaxID=40419 RepID=A0ACB8RDS4_9AGAM|nr:glycoside hydrolase family 16 protein [Auriscalpium vulgare]
MASRDPRYYAASNSTLTTPSTSNLLMPSPQPGVQATLAQGPRQLRQTVSSLSLNESPYPSASGRIPGSNTSIADKFSLSPDPTSWGTNLSPSYVEPDDFLHNPDPKRDRANDQGGTVLTFRGITNLGCLVLLGIGLVGLFAAYPIATYFTRHPLKTYGAFNIGGMNASGQVPKMQGNFGLVDLETPDYAYTRSSVNDLSAEMQLVFSDEFNTDGRSFYPGDDPYWEAVDLHYWQTNNLEWYDPAAVTTKNGALEITLSIKDTHGLNYQGGMITSWNKFCFTGGLIEASVVLPGANNVLGLWPAVWTMGNLGRAGYGASLEGMWPYTYDACDVGTVANQTRNGLPLLATTVGDPYNGDVLSYLQGQRLSRCTCPGESHPGPMHEDGTYVGRSAPEIDIFEATFGGKPVVGEVSQSAQFAPFNFNYTWPEDGNSNITDPTLTHLNSYKGGVFQQAVSALTNTKSTAYELNGNVFDVYGFEYKPGFDDAYITWIAGNASAWTLLQSGMQADSQVEIDQRPIPQEPLYIIANLGISQQFGFVDFDHLTFPATMKVDYIRVYQHKDQINIGCDPPQFPTAAYIDQYLEAYTNPNLTTWRDDFHQTFPKNSFLGQC